MKRYFQISFISFSVLALATACASGKWSYSGNNGPENWGGVCAEGKIQSPFDITAPNKAAKGDLKLNYEASAAEIVNNGHGLQVNLTGNNTLTSGGKTFNLIQFHFHTPSEYAINGKRTAAVAHLVHAAADGELAVVGILYDAGAANKVLAPVFDNAPKNAGGKKNLSEKINPKSMLPRSLAHYNFMGSLTTPPCSEGVNWFVLQSKVRLSKDQIAVLSGLYPDTARPLQARNDRKIRSAR